MAYVVIMPKLGFDMAEGTLVRWVKADGETVEKGDVLAEIETDKATVEVDSNFKGVVLKQLVEPGAVVPVSTPIAVIGQAGEPIPDVSGASPEMKIEGTGALTAEKPAPAVQSPTREGSVKASPLARRIARLKGLDLQGMSGSGPGGRIVKRDVETALAGSEQPAAGAAAPPLWQPDRAALPDQRIPVEKLRAIIGRRMSESKQSVPHFYVTHEFDVEALMSLRKQVNAMLPEEQKISVNDFIVKGVALALRQFPGINASLVGNEIIRHGSVNVGVAVALETGLMTVVVKDADVKALRVISTEVKEMAARARAGKVRPEEIEGSTFSISNLGMFDVEHFIAIINPLQNYRKGAVLKVWRGDPFSATTPERDRRARRSAATDFSGAFPSDYGARS